MKDVLYKCVSLIVVGLFLTSSIVTANQGRFFVPSGARMVLRLVPPIRTEMNRPGDWFRASVISPARYDGALIRGHISRIDASGRLTGRTEMGLAFDAMEIPDGRALPFNAELVDVRQSESVKMVDEDGNVISGSRSRQAIRR